MNALRFLLLVVVLNVIRYLVGGLVEAPLIMPYLFGAMQESTAYFNTDFATLDWMTSYFYNFMMWLTVVWLFYLLHPVLSGHMIVKSLKVFGMGWLFFASVSAIYMNHYSHPKAFYFWNILDAVIVFTIVAIANGLLYPLIMGKGENAAAA